MIYLVEDDEATRDAIRLLLECEDLPVRDFPSCDDLWATADLREADCLILDVHMAGTSGIALLERLASEEDPPPVILMSGMLSNDTLARADAAGAFAVVEKPFDADDFLALVAAALAARGAGG